METFGFMSTKIIKKFSIPILFITALLLYVNTLGHDFVYDDAFFIHRRELRNVQYIPKLVIESYLPNNRTAGAYRPITVISFAFNYILFGESPLSFHLFNIVLHATITVLFYIVLRKAGFTWTVSFIAGMLFAVHPIHVEAVANIKARDELFHALFLLLSVLSTLHLAKTKKFVGLQVVGIGGIFFLGLMAKEMAITIPIIVSLIMYVKKISLKTIIIQNVVFIVFLLVYLLLRYAALGGDLVGSFYSSDFVGNKLYIASTLTRIFSGFEIYGIYMRTLFFPLHLSATYGYAQLLPITEPLKQLTWIPGFLLFVLTISLCVFSFFKKWFRFSFLLLLWLILYLPISQMLLAMGDIVAERWMYAPSLMFFLIFAFCFTKFFRSKKIVAVFLGSLLVLLSIRTIVRNTVWASNFTIYYSMAVSAPRSVQAQTALAYEYFKKREYEMAKKHIDIAQSIYPDFPHLQNIMGNVATLERRYPEAEARYKKSIELSKENLQTYIFLAGMYFVKGDYEKALEQYKFVISKKVTFTYLDMISYAATLSKLKRYDESLSVLNQLTRKEREEEQTQFLFAVNYYKKGDKEKVLEYIRWNRALTRTEREKQLESY